MSLTDADQFAELWWLIAGLVLIIGLCVGSFLNVVAWRVPAGQSILRPPSACPECAHPIRARDNIPVVSWLVLKGRCRDCAAPIAKTYPLTEFATGVLFVLVWLKFGLGLEFLAYAYLAALAVVLTRIDLAVHRLPDVLVLPAYGVLTGVFALECARSGQWWPLATAFIGAASLFALYFIAAIVYPGGMGFGDVKLAGVLGLALGWLGWGPLVVGSFSAFLVGGVVGGILLASKRVGRKGGIPFGPWMLVGAGIGIGFGTQIWDLYMGTWS